MAGPYDYSAPLAQAAALPQPQEGASILNGISQGLQLRYAQFDNAFKMAQIQRQMGLQQQQDAAQHTALSDPTPQNIQKWQIAAPEQWQATKAAHDSLNTDTQRTNMQDAAAVYGYLGANNVDGATKILQNRVDAGQSHLQPLLDMIQSGDAAKIKQAQAVAGMTLASYMGPEQFANTYGTLAKTPGEVAQQGAQKALTEAQTAKERVLPLTTAEGGQVPYIIGSDGQGGSSDQASPAPTQGQPAQGGQAAPQPRGVRNNNPVNVSNLASGKWAGQTGSDGQYAVFSTPQAGWAAADKNLQSYAEHHGINTVAGIVSRWAPESGGNNTAAYIGTVAGDLGVNPNQPLDLSKPDVRKSILQSMSKVELGNSAAPQASAPPAPAGAAPPTASGAGLTVAPAPGFTPGESAKLTPQALEQSAQQYVATGVMPDMGRGNIASVQKAQIIDRAAQIEAANGQTGYDVAARRAATAANTQALTTVTQQANAMHTAEQTVLKNMSLVTELAKKGAGKTGSPWANAPLQALRKNGWGNADVAAFDEAIGATADEFATYIGKGTPSVSGREDAKERLDKAATPGQLLALMAQMRKQMANQASSYDGQRDALIGSIRTGIASSGHALPQPKSPEEVKKLPSGTAFLTPDGQMRVSK